MLAVGIELELHLSGRSILKHIASEFGDGRGDSHLVLPIEVQQFGNLTGALPGKHNIVLVTNFDRQDRGNHGHLPKRSFTTSTVASSRPRRKSRCNVPA